MAISDCIINIQALTSYTPGEKLGLICVLKYLQVKLKEQHKATNPFPLVMSTLTLQNRDVEDFHIFVKHSWLSELVV